MDNEYTAFSSENSMLHLHRLSAGSAGPAPTDMAAFLAGPEARRALAATSLEHAQPDLLNSLTRLAAEAEPLLSDMEDTLDALKEMFLERLRARLTEVGVNVEETRLVVGLDAAGRFGVPDRTGASGEALDAALTATPELEAVLREIARQSLLLRGLQDIGAAVTQGGPAAPGAASADRDAGEARAYPYHVCLRGALSHFYFPAR